MSSDADREGPSGQVTGPWKAILDMPGMPKGKPVAAFLFKEHHDLFLDALLRPGAEAFRERQSKTKAGKASKADTELLRLARELRDCLRETGAGSQARARDLLAAIREAG